MAFSANGKSVIKTEFGYLTPEGMVMVSTDSIICPDGRVFTEYEDTLCGDETIHLNGEFLIKGAHTYILEGNMLIGPETWTDVEGMDEAKIIVAMYG